MGSGVAEWATWLGVGVRVGVGVKGRVPGARGAAADERVGEAARDEAGEALGAREDLVRA